MTLVSTAGDPSRLPVKFVTASGRAAIGERTVPAGGRRLSLN
jgi:hypothetical protein